MRDVNRDRVRYLGGNPRKVPADGRVLVHNHVRPRVEFLFPGMTKDMIGRDMIGLGMTPSYGWNGFRA